MPPTVAISNEAASALGYDGGLHCDLRVSNLDESLAWYREVLGFEVIHHVPQNGWAELRSPVGSVAVGLTEVETLPQAGGGAVLTFGVTNRTEIL